MPLHAEMRSGGVFSFCIGDIGDLLETCRMLVSNEAADVLIEDPDILATFHGSLSALRYLQRELYPFHDRISDESRVRIASRYAADVLGWHNSVTLLETLLMPSEAAESEILSLPGDAGWEPFQNLSMLGQNSRTSSIIESSTRS